MLMKRQWPWLVAGAVALVTVIFFCCWEKRNFLRDAQTAADELRRANDGRIEAERQRDVSVRDVERLRAELADLPRLRGELTRTREELRLSRPAETAVVRAASQGAGVQTRVFGAEASDVGGATPERAATSLIWAAMAGDRQRLAELLELPKGVSEADAPQHYEHFANLLASKFSQMEMIGIRGVSQNPDGTLRLGIEYRDLTTGLTNPFPFMLRRHGDGWRIVVEN